MSPSSHSSPLGPPQKVDKRFEFVPSQQAQEWLAITPEETAWRAFAKSWDDMPEDLYMADGGRYRQRRHGVFDICPGQVPLRKPAQPHYQSRDRNPLNGGVERWFAPLLPEVEESPVLQAVFAIGQRWLPGRYPDATRWHSEVHQFRILARDGVAGQPTPEGMHRDGVDFVVVMLVRRENVQQGTTTIADLDKRPMGSFTLTHPMDMAWVDDQRAFHGVTPILPLDPRQEAFRDVLVVTWKQEPPGKPSHA